MKKFIAFPFHRTEVLFGSTLTDSLQYLAKKMKVGSCSGAIGALLLLMDILRGRTARDFRRTGACGIVNKL